MKTSAVTKKPSIDTDLAMKFASPEASQAIKNRPVMSGKGPREKMAQKPVKAVSGLVPADDVRLTANIRKDLHLKLKIAAAESRTTIGEIIEALVARHLDKDMSAIVQTIEQQRKEQG